MSGLMDSLAEDIYQHCQDKQRQEVDSIQLFHGFYDCLPHTRTITRLIANSIAGKAYISHVSGMLQLPLNSNQVALYAKWMGMTCPPCWVTERVPNEADRVLLVQRSEAVWDCGCAPRSMYVQRPRRLRPALVDPVLGDVLLFRPGGH